MATALPMPRSRTRHGSPVSIQTPSVRCAASGSGGKGGRAAARADAADKAGARTGTGPDAAVKRG